MNAFMLLFWRPELEDRLLFHDRGARQRRRRCVEPQILSNAGVHQSRRRKSAKQPQTIREPAGRVAEFWAVGDGRFVRSFLDTSSRRPECRSISLRMKAPDCPDSKYHEYGQDDELNNDESRIRLRRCQCVQDGHLQEGLCDQNKDIQI
jgi:hypothetical protein